MPENYPECELIKIWQNHLTGSTELVTEEGDPVKIIYPGRINGGQGPDFQDTVITIGNMLLKGHIEVHIKSGSWYEHGHHHDKAYNSVILHVVMWHNTENATILENGKKIPVLALHKYINSRNEKRSGPENPLHNPSTPCLNIAKHPKTGDLLNEFLDKAGEERFFNKVSGLQADLSKIEAGECLYQGIMRALGYSGNKHAFTELAHRLPLKTFTEIFRNNKSEEECLARQQALLLGTAGLLPSQHDNIQWRKGSNSKWIIKLERLWKSYNINDVMPPGSWHFCNIRPGNSPILRLLAVSFLALRYRRKGFLEGMVDLVKESPLKQGCRRLERGLIITAGDYQSFHNFFSLLDNKGSPAFIGYSRAAEIIVNILLPFTFAWSRFTLQPVLEIQSLELYVNYPKLEANTIERHMIQQLGLESRTIKSARQQQGLIHIYKNFCTEGRCKDCPLSQLEVGNYIHI